jgi:hypothetical protein
MVGVMTLLDYTGAFDATARSFTDLVLGKSGSRRKLRSLHRKMAAAATDRVRTQGLDGAEAETEPFKMTRGGIQGLGSTAYLFILCLSEILEEDDALNNDLDYAIRRECLRIETLEREEAEGGVVHEQWLAPVTKQWTREAVVGTATSIIGSVTSTRPMLYQIAQPPPRTKRRDDRVEVLKRILENYAAAAANGDFEAIAVRAPMDQNNDDYLDEGEWR